MLSEMTLGTWKYPLIVLGILLAFGLIMKLAQRYPESWWAILFFRYPIGPRTDIKFMTRSELFRSGRTFLVYAIVLFVFLVSLMFGMGPLMSQNGPILLVLLAVYFLRFLFLICAASSLVLFVRGIFRSRGYVPPPNTRGWRRKGRVTGRFTGVGW